MLSPAKSLKCYPLTPERWDDFTTLFGHNGACGVCGCMVWRLKRPHFVRGKGDGNKNAIHQLVKNGVSPGILGYLDDEPVGWCAVAPRADYPALERSRVLKPIDDTPVWSISCLFVARGWRSRGVSVELLKAAVKFVRRRRGKVVEGYPVEPRKARMPAVFAWAGVPEAFRRAGFVEVARGSATRPIMRWTSDAKTGQARSAGSRRTGRGAGRAGRRR